MPDPRGLRPHRQPALWPRQGQLERSNYRRGRMLGMRRPDIRVAGSPIEPPWPEFGPRWTELGLHWIEFGLYWTELGPGLNALERHPHCLNRAQTGHSLGPSRWSTVLASSSAAQARSSAHVPVQARHQHVQPRAECVRARSERVQARPHHARSRSRIWITARKPWRSCFIHSILSPAGYCIPLARPRVKVLPAWRLRRG